MILSTVKDQLNSILFPQQCPACHGANESSSNGSACYECWQKTTIFTGNEAACVKCGLVLGPKTTSHETRCWQCDPHKYDHSRAVGIYEHALAAEVISLKTTPKLGSKAKELLFEAFERSSFGDTTMIVPVPLSTQRYRERGFNQAEVIGKELSVRFGIPIDAHSLGREHHSPLHRVGMDRKARNLSVKNAFRVSRPNLVNGQHILLVDDVCTTGATLSYCAKALKKAGASSVNAFTLTRAVTADFI